MDKKEKSFWVIINFIDETTKSHDNCKSVDLEGAGGCLFIDDGNFHWYPMKHIKSITRNP